MPNCNVDLKNCDAKIIAKQLRETANSFDPWPSVRGAVFWFAVGAFTIAAMDFGDVWICAGQCNAMTETTTKVGKGAEND